MPDHPPSGESSSAHVLNAETRRALREWGRRLYATGVGVLIALVMLIPSAITAARPGGLLFHLAVTLVFSLMLPVVAVYVGVRAYGLSHHEVVCAARHAAREGAAATATLGEHQRVEQPAEPIETDATTPFTDTETDETQ